MEPIKTCPLKTAADFVNSGRSMGVPDSILLEAIQRSAKLSFESFEAVLAWFHGAK